MFRRLASVAALALVGGLALAGCQAVSPSVAVQIGDFSITNERIDQIVDQIDDELAKARQSQADPSASPGAVAEGLAKEQVGDVRGTVVQLTVFDEVARRMAADRKLTLPAQDYKASADQIGLTEANPYVKLAVDSDAYRTLLGGSVKAVVPTEDDLRAAYARVLATAGGAGQVPSYEELKPQLLAVPELGQGLALKTEMLKAFDQYHVVVNPRYLPLEMPLTAVNGGSGQIVLVSLPLGASSSPAVRDLPAPVVGPTAG